MRKHTLFTISLATIGVLAVVACGNPKSETPPLGDMAITTSAPTVEQAIATSDGWSIKYDRFLVHFAVVNVAGAGDSVVAATSDPQILDQVAPGAKSILFSTVRIARLWDDVSFEIGPATADATPLSPVTEADRDMMTKGAFSIYVEAKATKGAVTKTIKLGIPTDTTYNACQGDLNGAPVVGILVPADGVDSPNVTMRGDVLFADDLVKTTVLRADAIVAADANNDGVVTSAELHAVTIDVAQQPGGGYVVGPDHPEIVDLGGFVEEIARSTVSAFRSPNGKCTTVAVTSATVTDSADAATGKY